MQHGKLFNGHLLLFFRLLSRFFISLYTLKYINLFLNLFCWELILEPLLHSIFKIHIQTHELPLLFYW